MFFLKSFRVRVSTDSPLAFLHSGEPAERPSGGLNGGTSPGRARRRHGPACGSAVRTAGPQRVRGNRAHGARPTRGSRGGSAARARSGGRPRTARGEPPEPRALRGPVGPASQNAHVSDARDFLQHPNCFKNWCFSLSKPLSRLPSGSRPHSKGPARTAAPHASPWGSLGTLGTDGRGRDAPAVAADRSADRAAPEQPARRQETLPPTVPNPRDLRVALCGSRVGLRPASPPGVRSRDAGPRLSERE